MAGESPKPEEDVELKEYELLSSGWCDPVTRKRFKKGDTVKVEAGQAEVLLRLGSLGEKGTVKASEEETAARAEKAELHQQIHMGMVDPAAKDEADGDNKVQAEKSDEDKTDKSKVNVRSTPK